MPCLIQARTHRSSCIFSLRAVIRTTLASCPPSAASAFTFAARKRLAQTIAKKPLLSPSDLFTTQHDESLPSEEFKAVLRRSRALYGAGMALASLDVLTSVVRGTLGHRWKNDGKMVDTLAAVDADIAQALQSAREEFGSRRVNEREMARAAVRALEETLSASLNDTIGWKGEFPFERALADVQCWKI